MNTATFRDFFFLCRAGIWHLTMMSLAIIVYIASAKELLAQEWPTEVERQLRDTINDPIYILARLDAGENRSGMLRILQSGFSRTLNPSPSQLNYQRKIFESIYGKTRWSAGGDLHLTIADDKGGSGTFLPGASISGKNIKISLAVLREARDWAVQSRSGNPESFLSRQKELLALYDDLRRDRRKYSAMRKADVFSLEQQRFIALSETVNHSFVVVVNFLLAHEAAHAYLGHKATSCAQLSKIEQEADGYALIHHTNLMRNLFRQPNSGSRLLGVDTLTGAGARFASTHRIGNTAPACGYLGREARRAEMLRIQSEVLRQMR